MAGDSYAQRRCPGARSCRVVTTALGSLAVPERDRDLDQGVGSLSGLPGHRNSKIVSQSTSLDFPAPWGKIWPLAHWLRRLGVAVAVAFAARPPRLNSRIRIQTPHSTRRR